MTEKALALRLAALIQSRYGNDINDEAAAELRRLHGLDFALRDCELALQKMATKYMDAADQRDALLEALRQIAKIGNQPYGTDYEEIDEAREIARAAIAKAEGEAMKTWEVWREGYRATGESAGANLEGKVEADTWPEACRKACVDSGRWKEQPGGFDAKRLTVWGCRLFDNEADARRSFG